MKRILSALLAIIMCLSLPSIACAANTDNDCSTAITDQCPVDYSNLSDAEQSIIRANEARNFTEEQIAAMTDEELEYFQLAPITTNSVARASAYYQVSTTNVQQSTSYYCGPASVLQALYTAGVAGSVSGSTNTQKQQTLAGNGYLYTDRDNATWIEYIPAVMNTFTGRTRSWATYTITNDTTGKDRLSYRVRSNLMYGNAVIYLLDTQYLGYYSSHSCYHYVTGTRIYSPAGTFYDYASMTLRLADPHYSASYYGNHTVAFNQVVAAQAAYTASVGPANLVW